jgi:hypothetical protein
MCSMSLIQIHRMQRFAVITLIVGGFAHFYERATTAYSCVEVALLNQRNHPMRLET